MLEGQILDGLLRGMVRRGQVTLTDWDGRARHYGWGRPFVEVALTDPAVARRLPFGPSMALGEAYAAGTLQVSLDDLPVFFDIVMRNRPGNSLRLLALRARNTRGRQRKNIETHYDEGGVDSSRYHELFLGSTRIYSCAVFGPEGCTLDEAQGRKVEYLLRKLHLQPGQRLLDIGCGWGRLAVAAALAHPDLTVLGITLSSEQLAGARRLAEERGVAGRVKFELRNYQDLSGTSQFDRIVSVGMFEHVGPQYYGRYFDKVVELLADHGVFVLHTIIGTGRRLDPWVDRYIFPGGHLPTVSQIVRQVERTGLRLRHEEDLKPHYFLTLDAWRRLHNANRDRIVELISEEVCRRREWWLAMSQQAFGRHGPLGLAQFVILKGRPDYPMTMDHLAVPALS